MAFYRPVAGLMLLSAAVGGPYLVFEAGTPRPEQEVAAKSDTAGGTSANGRFVSTTAPSNWNELASGEFPETGNSDSLPQYRIQALQEVLRFDISPQWLPQRFSRVSTVLGDLRLDGLRVPLVTGTRTNDLAGTLTYYFDPYQRVQRITVHAVTGDPSRFVAELQHAYQLQQQPALGGQLYLKKWNGRPTSVVHTTSAPVLKAEDQYSRYTLFVELNQGGLEYGLSQEAQKLLAEGQQTRRWR